MATRELSNKLASGELTQIKIGGTASTNILPTVGENDAKYETITNVTAISNRVTALEATHQLLLTATSLAASQEPTALDTPLQVEFGALQTTTDIDISAAGAVTFNTAGKYIITTFFQYGRTGASGTSELLNRYLVNGSQAGVSLAAKVDNAETLVPWSSTIQFTAAINDVLTIEIMRDSAGANFGGLFAITPSVVGWALAPCASTQIYRAV